MGSGRSGGGSPGRGGRIRPPSATGRPEGSQIGNRTRPRKASCARPRRLMKPRPESVSTRSGSFRALAQRIPLVRRPSQAELAHDLPVIAPRAQVVPGQPGIGRAQQPLVVPDDGPLHGVEEVGPPLAVLPGLRVLVQGDPGPVGQEPYGVDEVEVLGGPDEGDGIARGLAAEAVVEPLLGVDAERRALLGVERAQAGPAAADPLERGVLADEGDDVGCRPHLGHVLVRYRHWMTVPRRCVRSGRAGPRPGRPVNWPCGPSGPP